jgi:hypothetical protein
MSEWTDFETGSFGDSAWQAEQRRIVELAKKRGWIKTTTNGTDPAPENPPAANVARKKEARPPKKGKTRISSKPFTMIQRFRKGSRRVWDVSASVRLVVAWLGLRREAGQGL